MNARTVTDGGDHRPPASPGEPRTRSTSALIVAAILVVTVVLLVLVFGIARPPALRTLAEDPTPVPTSSVAWSSFDDGEQCVHVADPDGTVTELVCRRDTGQVWAWDDQGIVLSPMGPSQQLEVLDPQTGEVLGRRDLGADDPALPREYGPQEVTRVFARHDSGLLTVTRQDTDEIVWEVEAPEGYDVSHGTVSTDGAWIAMFDTAERLLVVPADGSAPPRVWVEDATAWETPVWEGTPLESGD